MKPGLLLFLLLLLSCPLYAVVKPAEIPIMIEEGPRVIHKKFSIIERFKLLKKTRKLKTVGISAKQKRQARLSLVLGLTSFAFLFMPFAMFVAFPLALGGLIFGIKSVNGNSNAQGIIGIVASSVALSIFLIVGIVWLSIALAGL